MTDNLDNTGNIKVEVTSTAEKGGGESNASNNEKLINDTVELIKKFQKEITEFKNKTIEILAIFVALFTFISVEIQILKFQITFLSVFGFSVFILGALLGFIFILHLVLNESETGIYKNKITSSSFFIIFITILIVAGMILTAWDYKKFTKERNEKFYTKEEIDSKFLLINKENLLKIEGNLDANVQNFKSQ